MYFKIPSTTQVLPQNLLKTKLCLKTPYVLTCSGASANSRGVAGMGLMGSAEPINFQREVLEPMIFWANSIEIHHFETNGC